MYPTLLEKLVETFKMLPGVGQKTAERYAMCILETPEEDVENFSNLLKLVKTNIKECPVCGNITQDEKCIICNDTNRDKNTICVVQQPKDVIAIEKMGQFNGVYHVLHGAISPLKGIMPEDLNIESLLNRITSETKEIIIATNSNMEGDTTALYLTKILKEHSQLTITRLASGLPMGSNLDYADNITLSRAFNGRIRQ